MRGFGGFLGEFFDFCWIKPVWPCCLCCLAACLRIEGFHEFFLRGGGCGWIRFGGGCSSEMNCYDMIIRGLLRWGKKLIF